ncbi:MAG: hypothetical protein JSU87_14910 [Gemmatimonadota bacterium]|nr:MAG: hypothetical protein JSU87_14910 [Gemmatimonadota bacterium]
MNLNPSRKRRFEAGSFAVAAALLLLTAGESAGQDAHYWTLHYGPRSSLLGGAVIGSVDDVSGTYYNPGALGLAEDLAFAVSTNVFEFSVVGLEDGAGEGVDLGTARSGLQPSLLAGTITKDLFGSGVLAYSALTRTRGEQDLQGLIVVSGADIPPDVELTDFAALGRFEGNFNEFWGGLTYSHRLGSQFGLGVTWYGALRSQRRRVETASQGVGLDGSGAAEIDIRGGKYSSLRTLFKFGAFAVVGPLTGGLTVTTPSIHITGSGQLGFDKGTFAPDTAALAVTIQTDLPAEFKSPLSVGFGLGWRIGDTRLHASGEWYDAIDPYVVIQGEDFVAQEPEEVIEVDAVQALDEVFNWSVGVEHTFSPKLTGYLSYYLDASGLSDKVERAGLSTNPLDINTVTLGTDFVVSSARLTLGLGYGWGRKVDEALTDLLRQEDEDFEATFVYRSFRFLFGFEIGVG